MGSDLKSEISTSGLASRLSKGLKIGDPNDKFYIMQAEHMVKSGNSAMALHFVKQALEYNRENRVRTENGFSTFRPFLKANGLLQEALVLLARCHLLRLDWESALKTADLALSSHKKDVRALTVKGEALFNLCEFEHALVFFSRALVSFLKSFRIYTWIHSWIVFFPCSKSRKESRKFDPLFRSCHGKRKPWRVVDSECKSAGKSSWTVFPPMERYFNRKELRRFRKQDEKAMLR